MGERAAVTIRRQVLEVDLCGTEAEGHALQRRLPRVCADVLSPAIESALRPFDAAGRFLYLDRVHLEVTVSSLDDLEAELANAVRRGIEEHLVRHPPAVAGPAGVAARVGPDETPASAATGTVAETLVVFLRTGRLPWWFSLPPGTTLEQVVLAAWAEVGGAPGGLSVGGPIHTALAIPDARERLLAQFTPGFVLTLLRTLSPELAVSIELVEATLDAEPRATTAGRGFLRRVRQAALEAVMAGEPLDPATLVGQAWAATGAADRAEPALAAVVERAWPGAAKEETTLDPWPAIASGRASPPAPDPAPLAGPDRVSAAAPDSAPVAAPEPAPVAATQQAYPSFRDDDQVEHGGMLVDHAGIVLLHPFLPRFFTGLGVAAGDELVDPDRALCLLHHLATGEVVAPEYRLTLAKALCGVPLESPCASDVGLTSVETAEATALLEAAIGHWAALRSTSPDGLRAEFLQRPGVLSVTADGDWLLRVEGRTVDILLDQLPWGFSPLRLPWMSRLMMVEWR